VAVITLKEELIIMNFLQRRARLKKANYLDLTPMRVEKEEIIDNNLVVILIPKFKSQWAGKHLVPKLKAPYIKLKLDELGSASWLLMDGEKKVDQIALELAEKFDDKNQANESYEARLIKFLTLLYDQKLITFKEIIL